MVDQTGCGSLVLVRAIALINARTAARVAVQRPSQFLSVPEMVGRVNIVFDPGRQREISITFVRRSPGRRRNGRSFRGRQ